MRAVGLGAVLVLLLVLAHAPAASAADRRVCARSAVLRESPEGFVIAYLRRGTVVRYLRRSANRRFAAVRLRTGLTGWVPASAVCRTKVRNRSATTAVVAA